MLRLEKFCRAAGANGRRQDKNSEGLYLLEVLSSIIAIVAWVWSVVASAVGEVRLSKVSLSQTSKTTRALSELLMSKKWIKPRTYPLASFEETPPHLRYPYIHQGYRPENLGLETSLESAFHCHNETGNIWTHLIPFLALAPITAYSFSTIASAGGGFADYLVIGVQLLACAKCFLFSTMFHALMSIGDIRHHCKLLQLDHFGILFSSIGFVVPTATYGFRCHPEEQALLFTLAPVLFACVVCVSYKDCLPKGYRLLKVAVIGSYLTFVMLFPVIRLYSLPDSREDFDIVTNAVSKLGVFLALAGFCYAGHLPERFSPGTFDYIGNGHQLMHVAVAVTALTHHFAAVEHFLHAQSHPCGGSV